MTAVAWLWLQVMQPQTEQKVLISLFMAECKFGTFSIKKIKGTVTLFGYIATRGLSNHEAIASFSRETKSAVSGEVS